MGIKSIATGKGTKLKLMMKKFLIFLLMAGATNVNAQRIFGIKKFDPKRDAKKYDALAIL